MLLALVLLSIILGVLLFVPRHGAETPIRALGDHALAGTF
jgi:hypothetical protein